METVSIPAFEFQFNLMVFPKEQETVSFQNVKMYTDVKTFQDKTSFYVLKNNGVKPISSGSKHWIEFLPGYDYCFIPSLEACLGEVHVYSYKPEFIKNFDFCMEIHQVCLISNPAFLNDNWFRWSLSTTIVTQNFWLLNTTT